MRVRLKHTHSLRAKRNPPDPGAVEAVEDLSSDDEYGSGLEDNEEDEDGLEEHDLQKADLKLLDALESDDDLDL